MQILQRDREPTIYHLRERKRAPSRERDYCLGHQAFFRILRQREREISSQRESHMSMAMAMAEECSTHRYLLSPSHPLQGICPYCLTQRIRCLKIKQKQVSSFSFNKKRRSNNTKSFFLSLFSKLHCGRCLPCKNQFSGNIPNQTQFFVDDSGQDSTGSYYEWASSPDGVLFVDREEHATQAPLHQVNGVDLKNSDSDDDGSDYEWAPSPDGVLGVKRKVSRIVDHFERKQEPATRKEMHPTALSPLAHHVNGVEADGDSTSDGDLFFSCQSSPSPSSGNFKIV
ncbi:hypothetical protein AMTRI_Chr12g238210 [Amborella trichopoda]